MFTYVQHVAKEVGARLYTNTSAILGKCFSLAVKPELGKKQIWAGNILLLQTKNFQIPTPCHLEPLFFKTFPNPGNPR